MGGELVIEIKREGGRERESDRESERERESEIKNNPPVA